MNNKTYGWALVLLVLVFAVATIVAYQHNHQRTLNIPTANTLAVYTNDTYGYSFYYPADFTVRVSSEEQILVGLATSTEFVEFVTTRVATSTPDATSYTDFVRQTLLSTCAERAGYQCTEIQEKGTFTSGTNLAGEKYYLELITPSGSHEKFGPLFAFNIGGNVTNAKYATLLIYRPVTSTGAFDVLPAQDVAAKLEIEKPATP